MQTLSFTYSTDGVSMFKLDLTPEGNRITGNDLILMGKYIQLLFATIRQIGDVTNSNVDIDELIRKLMNEGDE